jgi:hypothetical protein
MTDILTTSIGRAAALTAQKFLLRRRLSRFFKRGVVIDFEKWMTGEGTSLQQIVGQLNGLHDKELLDIYRLLGVVGGLDESITDTTIYVDGHHGDDITGDGTEGKPYRSLWFLQNLPRRIRHVIRIVVKNQTVYDAPIGTTGKALLDFHFSDSGSLSFIGSGAPDYQSEETEIIDIDPMPNVGYGIQISGEVTGMGGLWAIMTTGTQSGQAFPVCHVSETHHRLFVIGDLSSVSSGDKFRLGRPNISIAFPDLAISSDDTQVSRISFCNLVLYYYNISVSGNISMPFVATPQGSAAPRITILTGGSINKCLPSDSGILSMAGIPITNTNVGTVLYHLDTASGGDKTILAGSSEIDYYCTVGAINSENGSPVISNCAAQCIGIEMSSFQVSDCITVGSHLADEAGITATNSQGLISRCCDFSSVYNIRSNCSILKVDHVSPAYLVGSWTEYTATHNLFIDEGLSRLTVDAVSGASTHDYYSESRLSAGVTPDADWPERYGSDEYGTDIYKIS